MIAKLYNHKKAVLAFFLALVMLVGLIPFTATEAKAVEITPTAEGAEPFTKDFNLDLWSDDNPNKYERHAMHYDGTSWNTLKTDKLHADTVAAAVSGKSNYVWFTNDDYNVDVSMDQMSGSIDDYDMMFASSEIVDPSKPLDLHFEHLFVKLTFSIEYGSEYGDTPPAFYFAGIDSHGSLNDRVVISGVRNGEPKKTYSVTEAHTVSAAINYGDVNDYTDDKIEVIVGDGTIPAGTEFLYFFRTLDDQNPLTVTVPEGGLTFVAGKHYEFDLKVGKDKVTLTPTTTDTDFPGWDNDSEEELNGISTIGTQDAGKTAWETNDEITVILTSDYYGEQTATLTYNGDAWTSTINFMYLENETPTVTAVYNPSDTPGLGEYLTTTDYTIADNALNISFANATRTYSRLRIAAMPKATLTVTTTGFTPAGPDGATAPESYTLTTDDDGNAFLYGTFAGSGSVTVKNGDTELTTHTFTTATEAGKSYALYAGKKVDVDLSTLAATYVINDDAYYTFTGTGSYGIKVESGNPTIILNNANITLTDGDYFGSPVNGIHIASTSGTTTIQVVGKNSITAKGGAGIFVAEGGTLKITGNSREDVLTVEGAQGSSGIGGYAFLDEDYDRFYIDCGNITIDNVTVYTRCGGPSDQGDIAPGIGSAGEAKCGVITINSAVVYAYGAKLFYDEYGAPAIGSGFPYVFSPTSIPTVIVSNSSVHAYRSNSHADYIGWAGDRMGVTDATGSINCGDGGSVTNSTIYCYTVYGETTDKVVTYDADGNATEN